MKKANVTIEVVEKRGEFGCQRGHQIGDKFDFEKDRGKLCPFAMHSLLPSINVLRYGGELPVSKVHGDLRFCCPDADVMHVFRLTRE